MIVSQSVSDRLIEWVSESCCLSVRVRESERVRHDASQSISQWEWVSHGLSQPASLSVTHISKLIVTSISIPYRHIKSNKSIWSSYTPSLPSPISLSVSLPLLNALSLLSRSLSLYLSLFLSLSHSISQYISPSIFPFYTGHWKAQKGQRRSLSQGFLWRNNACGWVHWHEGTYARKSMILPCWIFYTHFCFWVIFFHMSFMCRCVNVL